jgi:hypothetical protein
MSISRCRSRYQGMKQTRKLRNQEFLLVKLKSSLRKSYGRHHDLVDRYGIPVWQMNTICSNCRKHFPILSSRVWRYQKDNHNPYIEEQTTQWPKEKVQKDKQLSTKHTYKALFLVKLTSMITMWNMFVFLFFCFSDIFVIFKYALISNKLYTLFSIKKEN